MEDPVWDFNPFMKLRYRVLPVKNKIASTEAEIAMSAGESGPPLHYHPAQEEQFRIVSGSLDFFVNGKWQTVRAGETLIVPSNTPHTFKNNSAEEVVLINTHKPALDFPAFMEKFYRLTSSGKLKRKPDLRTIIYLSMLWTEHEKELVSVKPSRATMRFFAAVGKIFGFTHT